MITVDCLSCGSALAVRDASRAGTIDVCPACGSMVQIPEFQTAPPSGDRFHVGDAAVDSSAATAEGVEASSSIAPAADSIDPPTVTAPPIEVPGTSLDASSSASLNASSSTSSAESNASTDEETSDEFSGASHGPQPVLTPAAFQSDATTRARRLAAIAAMVIAGLASIGGAVVILVGGTSDDDGSSLVRQIDSATPPPAAVDGGGTEVDPASDDSVEDRTDAGGGEATSSTSEDNVESTNPSDGNDIGSMPTDAADNATSKTAAKPTDTGLNATQRDPAAPIGPSTPSELPPPGFTTPGSTPGLPPLNDPFSLDPVADDAVPPMIELPESLRMFAPLSPTEDAPARTNLAPPPSIDDIRFDVVDPLIAGGDNKRSRSVDPRIDLAMPVAIKAGSTTLYDWASLIGQLTDVPIEVELVGFDLRGDDPAAAVTVDPVKQPIHDYLNAVASAASAELNTQPTLIRIVPGEATIATAIAGIVDRGDFDDPDSATKVLQIFMGVDAADDRLFNDDDPVNQKYLAAIATDALRRIRGLAGRIAPDAGSRWSGGLEDGLWRWPVADNIRHPPQSITPTTLVEYLNELGRLNGVEIVVDWFELARRGIGPATSVFPDVDVAPDTVITRTLDPLGIQIRQMPGKIWWIGTRARYQRLPVITWSRPLAKDRDVFETQIRTLSNRLGPENVRYSYDARSDRALLMTPRFAAEQL